MGLLELFTDFVAGFSGPSRAELKDREVRARARAASTGSGEDRRAAIHTAIEYEAQAEEY